MIVKKAPCNSLGSDLAYMRGLGIVSLASAMIYCYQCITIKLSSALRFGMQYGKKLQTKTDSSYCKSLQLACNLLLSKDSLHCLTCHCHVICHMQLLKARKKDHAIILSSLHWLPVHTLIEFKLSVLWFNFFEGSLFLPTYFYLHCNQEASFFDRQGHAIYFCH